MSKQSLQQLGCTYFVVLDEARECALPVFGGDTYTYDLNLAITVAKAYQQQQGIAVIIRKISDYDVTG